MSNRSRHLLVAALKEVFKRLEAVASNDISTVYFQS